jgi:hypothetical protein
MTAGGFQAFIGIIGLLCSMYLAFFHIRRAVREKGERETHDVVIGCAFAFGGLMAPLFTGVFDGLFTLPLPIWLGWVVAIGNIILLGAACTMFGDNKETGSPKNRKLSDREKIFAPHESTDYNCNAAAAFVANVIVFLV